MGGGESIKEQMIRLIMDFRFIVDHPQTFTDKKRWGSGRRRSRTGDAIKACSILNGHALVQEVRLDDALLYSLFEGQFIT